MRYQITFVDGLVGQSAIAPFEIDIPDSLGKPAQVADLARRIRDRVVSVLTYAPAPGASDARPVIAQHTQIVLMLGAGEGAAHYGTTTLGRFMIRHIG